MLLFTIFLSVFLLIRTENIEHGNGIIGGSDADITQYPHQVSLRENGKHYCGGSIYGTNMIITAAHCVFENNIEDLSIAAGFTLLSEMMDVAKVTKAIIHEEYNKTAHFDCDVAILVLDTHLSFNSKVQPIALQTFRPPVGVPVTVIGWGVKDEYEGELSEHLQHVKVNLVGNAECQKSLPFADITESMLCASVEEGGKNACASDSGGPLIYDKKLLGVVSWGTDDCAQKGSNGVYVSIPYVKDWIEQNAQDQF